ncbi:carboxylesterase family domain-containing protein [Phthorimaea operculella]|nr:carboxylesterase family domain-containing protein [Phthorimaea operculella]
MWCGRVCWVVAAFFALAHGQAQNDSRTVVTDQGAVRGYKDPGGGLYAFYNIPYATAPTGKDRYKAPLPGPTWQTVREAVDQRVVCPQLLEFGSSFNMQEDCLIANVFVPDTNETNRPVVVLIHGGAYITGHGNYFTPIEMVRRDQKLIYVSFNYRLGVHGFLCLGTPDVPGNAGMKDQLALLRWVQRNIASFGGNPNDVTIQGFSAGSSSVDLMLVSKAAKGLFHKAIPESGANVAMWSVQVDPIGYAKEFAQSDHGFVTDDLYALEEFYRTVPLEKMYTSGFALMYDTSTKNIQFTPCIERDTGVERFLDDNPVNILKSGDYNKVPMLYGYSNLEGYMRVQDGYNTFMSDINEKFSDYLPNDLQFENEEEKERVANEVKQFYFGDKRIDNDTILEYMDFFSDNIFNHPHLRSLRLQVDAGNDQIYLYQFSHPFEYPAPAGVTVKLIGSEHVAQSLVVLDDEAWLNVVNGGKDLTPIRNVTRQFWFNFITTGKPVPEGSDLPAWPAANRDRSPHMDITETPQLLGAPHPERTQLWDSIYDQYYRAPTPPPAPPSEGTPPNLPSASLRIEPALGMVAFILLLRFL